MLNFFKKKSPSSFQLELQKVHDADHSIPNSVAEDHSSVCEESVQHIIEKIKGKLLKAAAVPGKKKLQFNDDLTLHLNKDEKRVRYGIHYDTNDHEFYTNNYHDAEILLAMLINALTELGATGIYFVLRRDTLEYKEFRVHSVNEIMTELRKRERYPSGVSHLWIRIEGQIHY